MRRVVPKMLRDRDGVARSRALALAVLFGCLVPSAAMSSAQAQTGAVAEAQTSPEAVEVAPAPPAPMASLLIAVNADDAQVRVDGELVGQSPLAPLELLPGRHVISVTRRGFQPGSRSLDLDARGARLDFALELDPAHPEQLEPEPEAEDVATASPEWYRRWYVWAGAGGALVIGAVIIGVAASSGGGTSAYPLPPIQP